ncbi:MAG: biotin transporter BioY [Bacteroidetes bacterium]|nr:biotin transporter BioY [Bacteroidota bacterium]
MSLTLTLRSSQVSSIDLLRSESASVVTQVGAIVGFALLTAFFAQFRLYIWEVPFTLQTLSVYGSGLYLGWRNGLLSQLLYLVLGLFMPVYAGDGFGPAYLFGAVTAGYLLAYPLSSAAIGLVSKRFNGATGSLLSILAGSAILFSIGIVWLHYAGGHATWFESFDKGWLRFIPVDMAKILLVTLIYQGTRSLTQKG